MADRERDSSGSPGRPVQRRATDSSASGSDDDEEVDVKTTLLAPRKSGAKDNAPVSVGSTTSGRRTTRSASPVKVEKRRAGPASKVKKAAAIPAKKTASTGTRKKTAGKEPTAPKRSKKSKSATASTMADEDSSTDEEEEAGVRTVRSTSARGVSKFWLLILRLWCLLFPS